MPPNPNPLRFQVRREEVVAGKSLLLVQYAGCTTFDGTKLLLLKRKWSRGESLDPHLLGGNHIVLARFEPTEQGWAMARQCALMSNVEVSGGASGRAARERGTDSDNSRPLH